MPTYTVTGAMRDTGKEVVIENVDATTPESAEQIVSSHGVLAATVVENPPDYGGLVIAGYAMRVAGALGIALGLFIAAKSIPQAQPVGLIGFDLADWQAGEGPRRFWGVVSGMIVVAASVVVVGMAQAMLALRDIARNSWNNR